MAVGLYNKLFESITGIRMSNRELMQAGDRIYLLERYLNTREGISRKDDTLPERFLKEGRDSDPKKRTVPLEKMLKKYYRFRGYDENGIPNKETLRKYNITKIS
jgi:aldehyde:ferredoxin oxidoreductase